MSSRKRVDGVRGVLTPDYQLRVQREVVAAEDPDCRPRSRAGSSCPMRRPHADGQGDALDQRRLQVERPEEPRVVAREPEPLRLHGIAELPERLLDRSQDRDVRLRAPSPLGGRCGDGGQLFERDRPCPSVQDQLGLMPCAALLERSRGRGHEKPFRANHLLWGCRRGGGLPSTHGSGWHGKGHQQIRNDRDHRSRVRRSSQNLVPNSRAA